MMAANDMPVTQSIPNADTKTTVVAEGEILRNSNVDFEVLQAATGRTMSSRLLKIHEYRTCKQQNVLDECLKSSHSTAYLAIHGLDQSIADLKRDSIHFSESDEVFHNLVRLTNNGTRHIVERVEELLSRLQDLSATASYCLDCKQKDDLTIKNLRHALSSSEMKVKVLNEKLEMSRSRSTSSSKSLEKREQQIYSLRRLVQERDKQISKLESKLQRAEAWSSRSESLREKLADVEIQLDKLVSERAYMKMQLARARTHLEEEQVSAKQKKTNNDTQLAELRKDFEERSRTLRQQHRNEVDTLMKQSSDIMSRHADEKAKVTEAMLEAQAAYDALNKDTKNLKYRCDVLSAENKVLQQRINEIEYDQKYKKAGNRFLLAVRAAKAAKAAKVASEAQAGAEALAALQLNMPGETPKEDGAPKDEPLGNSSSCNTTVDAKIPGGNALDSENEVQRDIESRRDGHAGPKNMIKADPNFFLNLDGEAEHPQAEVGNHPKSKRRLVREHMRIREVPLPVGRLGPSELYVKAMSYFRPATSAPAVSQTQKVLANKISKAVAEREERVLKAWWYMTKMYTTMQKWRAISHSPCTITTLVALQQAKLDARLAKKQWNSARREKNAQKNIWDSICDAMVQLTNEVNGISSLLIPSRVHRGVSPAKGGGWETSQGNATADLPKNAMIDKGWHSSQVVPWRPPSTPSARKRKSKQRLSRRSTGRAKHNKISKAPKHLHKSHQLHKFDAKGIKTPLDGIQMIMSDVTRDRTFHFDQRSAKTRHTNRNFNYHIPSRPSTADGLHRRLRRIRHVHQKVY